MKIETLTPENQICFFGYYDKRQFSPDFKYFLFLRVDFQNREPKENDKAEIFIGEFETFILAIPNRVRFIQLEL